MFLNLPWATDKKEHNYGSGGATRVDTERLYHQNPSLVDHLPWVEYLPDNGAMLLQDGLSMGVAYKITSKAAVDGGSQKHKEDVRDSLHRTIKNAFPELDDPYVISTYLGDETGFGPYVLDLENEIQDDILTTPFTQDYLKDLREHLARVSNPKGVFEDKKSGGMWRAKQRTTYLTINRYLPKNWTEKRYKENCSEIDIVTASLEEGLQAAGVGFKRLDGAEMYEWLAPWLNPSPDMSGGDPYKMLEMKPYPKEEDIPYGWDFSSNLLVDTPEPDEENGVWWLNGQPCRFVSIEGLNQIPPIGCLTSERHTGAHIQTPFDRFPEGTTFVSTMIIWPKHVIGDKYSVTVRSAIGGGAAARHVRKLKDSVEDTLIEGEGEKLLTLMQGCYINARDIEELNKKTAILKATLSLYGFRTVQRQDDPAALDLFIKFLPMNLRPNIARVFRRETIQFYQHAVNVLPLFGRFTGTGTPGVTAYTKSGELISFDPLSPKDVSSNSHMLITGSTGAGKSATMLSLLQLAQALHDPRVIIVDGADSFPLYAEHCKRLGKTVKYLKLKPGSGVSLNPFANTMELLELQERERLVSVTDEEEERDVLGEAEMTVKVLLDGAGGDTGVKLTPAQTTRLRKAIVYTAETNKARGIQIMIIGDIISSLREPEKYLENTTNEIASELHDIADALGFYTDGIQGQLFNQRKGDPWPEVDVLVIELGTFIQAGYQGSLGAAIVGLFAHMGRMVQKYESDPRPTIVAIDELHLITHHEMLGPLLAAIIRLWRKKGAALWAATHSLKDFPDQAEKILGMMEWWLMLAIEPMELSHVERFKEITPDDKTLLLSAKKNPPYYTEGALLTPNWNALLRFVTIPKALALAMTDKWEKNERRKIMEEKNIDDYGAAMEIAGLIREGKWTIE